MEKKRINKEVDPLTKDIIDKFSNQLNQLIEDKKREIQKKGYSIFENEMYKKMGIGKTTLQNYKKDSSNGGKMPKNAELVKIHDYFGVSYSYLFGESNLKLNSKDNLIELGVELGLDDNAITTLSGLKKKADSNNLDDNTESYIKLFLINSLIQDKTLLDSLVAYFSITLGRNIIKEKCKGNITFTNSATDNSIYDMTKYAIMTNWIKTIEKLIQKENVPIAIRKHTEEYAIKYAGKLQPIIKEIINK